jgi:hypothetical protein
LTEASGNLGQRLSLFRDRVGQRFERQGQAHENFVQCAQAEFSGAEQYMRCAASAAR